MPQPAMKGRVPAVLSIGMVSVDHYIRVPSLPGRDEKVLGVRLGWFAGGMSANFAVAARQLGADTSLITTFSNDADARAIREVLEKHQVDTEGSAVIDGAESLSSVTFIDDRAERVMAIVESDLALPDAAHCVSVATTGAWDLVYLVALDAHWCRTIGQAAQSAGAMVVYDLEPFFVKTAWGTANFEAMMASAYFVFMKMDSVRAAGFTDAAGATKVLQEMGPQVVVVTDGPRAIYCATGEARFVASPPVVQVVDPTGAGDAFAGAFCSLYVQRRPAAECLAKATAVGALAVSHVGCQTYAPLRTDLLDSTSGAVDVRRV